LSKFIKFLRAKASKIVFLMSQEEDISEISEDLVQKQ
jgi:hypothetical protein